MIDVTRPTVFISGAAAGIGRATALKFAANGYLVGAYDIDETGLASLGKEAASLSGRVFTGTLDVTNSDQWETRLKEFVAEGDGRLDILINNAGILAAGAFEDMPLSVHRRQIDINVNGVVYGTHAAFPYLRDTPGAQVVNLCSASAIYGQPELVTYGASKFAVRGITEALDLEWSKYDIAVKAMWPLFVQTAMTEKISTGTTSSLGIKLTVKDVSDAIFDATRPVKRRLHKVHFPVGLPSKALSLGSRFSPAWLTREVNRRLSHT
ncbi:SDR family oxidoreductase [Rhodococcus fascians]|uniref:Diacetyl reductase n=2 Tax=root TaxID=1 RepID=A0A143QH68_RHOFA|nr:Diacetyl reductase [Rhodococcus fascians]AMY53910.1 Diacetyl reductase [Rhodococcus fascians D188]KJV02559.1 putative oxidoreductase [Rhodococcus sp. PML026]MSX05411.1 SDR family oxidoreductase [Actinomycetota bacterium]OZD04142.1 short-chain dehydrogenase [Rhodococcus sp. 06-221-2]OZD34509.1 short-chain dehydrogenase [Rhodococcus sp. 06-1477-1B]OZD52110.1 short-chain dehydrogenase [Rhodococcus sp. 06-1474-1B]OZD58152.1 short-chain dehydrogenase [Rhodococcus sp. 06-1460-1B]OZD89653.1 sho